MSIEASQLSVIVKSDGINQATDALNKLAAAGDKAEKSTAKLAKANAAAEASAKKSDKVWFDLLDKVSKHHEREYNALQRHNNRLYGLMQAEANKMNKERDRWLAQDAANAAKRRKQEQSQLEQLDVLRRNAAAKEYAQAHAEANRMNTMLERARKQNEAAAKTAAERQRVLNSNYSTAGLAQQIATLQRAQAYGASGGNIGNRFGSEVAGALGSGELQRLQSQYRQLGNEARRANSAMADSHAAVRGLSGSLGALWLTYGNILPLVAGAAVGTAIKGIVDVGADIEHTLEKIRVLGRASTDEIDQMRKSILELGKGVQGPRDVAEAFSVLTLAGLKANEAMVGVRGALNLAVAGDVSIEKSAQTLVQVSTSLGYTATGFDHVADVIAKTAAVSMSSVDSISGAFLSAAAVGEVYGASLQDIAVGLAAVANLGIQGTAAGTTLKNFYKDLSSGTEKSANTLADMGLKMRDLKGADGYFLPILDVVQKLEAGFGKLNEKARPEAMDRIFEERGVKTGAALISLLNQASTEVDALGQKYQSKLHEMVDEVEKSAAFATLSAIAMSQTTSNQLKSVGNTLQTVLGNAFASVAPHIGDVAREMKRAFNSPEFANGIKALAIGIADLTKFVVTHLDVIGKLVAAYAAWKITAFAAGLVEVAKGFTLASVGAKTFLASLGPITVAILAMGAAWAVYEANKNSALSNSTAAASLSEYADGVVSAAQTEQEVIELRKKGMSEIDVARKRQIASDKEAAAAAIRRSEQGLTAMRKEVNTQYAALNENQKIRAKMVLEGKTQFADRDTVKYVENLRNYTNALNTHQNQVKVVTSATEALIKRRQESSKLEDEAAKKNRVKPTGEQDLTQKPEKEAKKMATFIKNEADEMAKLTASYNAKNLAMEKTIEQGKLVAAETQQAIVLQNLLEGKYGKDRTENNELFQAQKRLAIAQDEAKAKNQLLHKYTEFSVKLSEIEGAQAAFNKAGVDGSNARFGALRKEVEGLIALGVVSEQAAERERKRADAADEFRRQEEARKKLYAAVDSSNNRAESALEEAQAMSKYGEVVKLTAMQVAELTIAKLRLNETGADGIKNALREAAATEQLNTAYRDLMKQQIDIGKKLEEAQAESKMVFVNSEAEKVKIAAESRDKIVRMELEKAEAAYNAKRVAGTNTGEDWSAIVEARNAATKAIADNEQLTIVETNNLRLKDWKKTIDDIEQIGREGFYNLTEKGVSLWSGMARSFKSMFKTTVMDYIYKQFAKPFILNVVASFAGAMGMDGLAQAANLMGGGNGGSAGGSSGGAGDVLGALGTAKTLYSTLTGATTIGAQLGGMVSTVGNLLGSSSISAFGSGMGMTTAGAAEAAGIYSSAGMASTGSALTAGSTLGAIAAPLVAAYLSYELAKTISGGYKVEGIGNVLNFGGVIGGLVNRAFGRKGKEVTTEGVRGTITSDGTTGVSYANWQQKGGWFRSDKRGTDTKALTTDISNTLTGGLNAMKATSIAFAESLGVSSNALLNYSKTFDITLGKDDAANQEAINKFFVELGDDMATRLVPNIMNFAKQGETASAVLQRLSQNFEVTKQLADALGKSVVQVFGANGMDSATARTKLVDLSGGADALAQKMSGYMSAIYTDVQKMAPVQKALAEAMGALGLAGVKTKEQFKAVVDGLNLTNEADIKLFNSLMSLAPAFGQVTDAVDNLATDARQSLTEAYNREADAIKSTQERMGGFIDSLKRLRESTLLGSLSPLTPQEKYLEAKSQFEQVAAAAKGGDFKAVEKFEDAHRAFLEASQIANASGAQYQTDFAYADAVASQIQSWAETQLNVANASLIALNKQVEGLISINQSVMSVSTAIQKLTEIVGTGGMDRNGSAIETLYTSLLGRSADAGGLDFWKSKASQGVSMEDIAREITKSPEYIARNGGDSGVVEAVNKLREEVAALREEQNGQTGDMTSTQVVAAEIMADRMIDALKDLANKITQKNEGKVGVE